METTDVIQTISQVIGSLGFPIAACIYMWKYINTTLANFTDVMNRNTNVLIKLCEKLDSEDGDELHG